MLSDPEKREKYNTLILGREGAWTRNFKNQKDYEFWKQDDSHFESMERKKNQFNENVERKKHEYKNLDDFLERLIKHKEKHDERAYLMREKGWREIKAKYPPNYNHYRWVGKEEKERYTMYMEDEEMRHYDSKTNDEYYSKPLTERMGLYLRRVMLVLWEFLFFWVLIGAFVVFSAFSQSSSLEL